MTKRKAIIIGCSGGYRNLKHLKGVAVDIENYKQFLKSDVGGAWLDSEIRVFDEVNSADLISYIGSINADYVFINFSGHGGTNKVDEQYICLTDKDITVNNIVGNSKKQTIVLDTCRQLDTVSSIEVKLQLLNEVKLFKPIKNARIIFDAAINNTPEGIIVVNSTQKGQSAGDDNLKGGHFTYSFIKSAKEWSNLVNQKSVLTLENSVTLTAIAIKKYFITNQTPEMSGQIRRITFPPFALNSKTDLLLG